MATRSPDYVTRGEGHFFSLRVDPRTRAELRPAITAVSDEGRNEGVEEGNFERKKKKNGEDIEREKRRNISMSLSRDIREIE